MVSQFKQINNITIFLDTQKDLKKDLLLDIRIQVLGAIKRLLLFLTHGLLNGFVEPYLGCRLSKMLASKLSLSFTLGQSCISMMVLITLSLPRLPPYLL